MMETTLRADCARCAALCCISLSFERSALFAFDKDAGIACRHLIDGEHRCEIHTQLEEHGFGGCTRYDCLGAGQYVVQHLFSGRTWRDDPSLLRPMSEAFFAMRRLFDLLALVRATRSLALDDEQLRERDKLEKEFELRGQFDLASLWSRETRLREDVSVFLGGLKAAGYEAVH